MHHPNTETPKLFKLIRVLAKLKTRQCKGLYKAITKSRKEPEKEATTESN